MFEKGLPKKTDRSKVQFTKTERNMKVTINDSVDWGTVHTLLQKIHFHECHEKFWKVPLYCKPIRTLTPVKSKEVREQNVDYPEVVKTSEISGSNSILIHRSKKVESGNSVKMAVNDFDFCDLNVQKTPISDAKNVSDTNKRKNISPAEQNKFKKKYNVKDI